jgi:hypothetical protein
MGRDKAAGSNSSEKVSTKGLNENYVRGVTNGDESGWICELDRAIQVDDSVVTVILSKAVQSHYRDHL